MKSTYDYAQFSRNRMKLRSVNKMVFFDLSLTRHTSCNKQGGGGPLKHGPTNEGFFFFNNSNLIKVFPVLVQGCKWILIGA